MTPTKPCTICKIEKPLTEFHRRSKAKDGLQNRCKPCAIAVARAHYQANRGEILVQAAEKYAADPDAGRKRLAKAKGYTLEEYDAMLAKGCGICGTHVNQQKGRRMHLDHNHTTGKPRAILCHGCNVGLGHFNDDPALLRAAADYLELHSS